MDVGDERGTTERVLTLLGLLQQRHVWTGPDLADRLGVTPRTVRRDVERLRTLGYPVHASQGVGGGYQLGPGKDVPPLLLDDEEAIATAVSLLAGAGGAVASAGDAALRALTKLDRVLPTRLRHEVRALSGSVESFGGGRTPVDPEALMTRARACRDEVEAGFDYPSGSEVRRRRVEPYRLIASDRRWYLLAYDLDRDDWRSFRADRMTDVSARTWRFRPRAAPARRRTCRRVWRVGSTRTRRASSCMRRPTRCARRFRRRRPSYDGEGASSARCSVAPAASTSCSCTCSCWGTTSRYSTLRSSGGAVARWRRLLSALESRGGPSGRRRRRPGCRSRPAGYGEPLSETTAPDTLAG
jgi:predicted DNA-binding transcriptional regulator YafY